MPFVLICRIDARHALADIDPVLRVLQLGIRRHRLRCGGGSELAEGRGAIRGRVPDDAALDRNLARRHRPGRRGGGDEHRLRGGAGLAQLQPGIGDGGRAAGALHRAEQEVVVELGVGRREIDAHLRPVRVELVGDDGGKARRVALSHVEMLDHHRDGVVRGDPDEGVGLSRPGIDAAAFRRQRLHAREGDRNAENERAGGGGGAAEKGAAGGGQGERISGQHGNLPHASAVAASWTAARMRW